MKMIVRLETLYELWENSLYKGNISHVECEKILNVEEWKILQHFGVVIPGGKNTLKILEFWCKHQNYSTNICDCGGFSCHDCAPNNREESPNPEREYLYCPHCGADLTSQ